MKKSKTSIVRRDREWYWEALSGKMIKDIYQDSPLVPDDDFNESSVEKAIERYQKTLQSY